MARVPLTTPYADFLPPLTTEEFESLRIDIERNGVRQEVDATEDGRVLDGHNRLRIDPDAPVRLVHGSADWSEDECFAYVVKVNTHRRNLSPEQKRILLKEKQRRALSLNKAGFTQEQIAICFGVTRQAIQLWLGTNASACISPHADARVKVPRDEWPVIVGRVGGGESQRQVGADYGVDHKTIAKIVAKQTKRDDTVAPAVDPCTVNDLQSLVDGGEVFGTIYADPPWAYSNQATRAATGNHYRTMAVDEIAALPVRELAAEQAHLWLWTTNAFLFECPRLFKAWGFEFKSSYVWCKPQMGIGNYLRNAHEILLLAVRGGLVGQAKDVRSWGEFNRLEHSAKPEEIRRQVVEAVSPGPYLELFGRRVAGGEGRPGWAVWGNQVERGMFDGDVKEIRSARTAGDGEEEGSGDGPTLFTGEEDAEKESA